MSMFNKSRDQIEEVPRPRETPAGRTVPPNQPRPTVAAAPTPAQTAPLVSRGGTNIGRTMAIKGEISGQEDLQIDGDMEGKLSLGGSRLVVGPTGKVRAEIAAREVDIHGTVSGNVEASEKIILRKNSKLVGDLRMASVEIEDGAYFKGSIDITMPRGGSPTAPADTPKPPGPPNAG